MFNPNNVMGGQGLHRLKKLVGKQNFKINKGIPSIRQMKQGQVKFCFIKDELYMVIKHGKKLYKSKFSESEL